MPVKSDPSDNATADAAGINGYSNRLGAKAKRWTLDLSYTLYLLGYAVKALLHVAGALPCLLNLDYRMAASSR